MKRSTAIPPSTSISSNKPTRFRRTRVRLALPLLGLAVAAIATAVLPGAGAASSTRTHTIRVTGSGVRAASSSGDVPFTFAFQATTRRRSGGVYGTFSGSYPHDKPFPAPGKFATFSGVVTCLQVSGRMATIGGVVTSGYGYDDTYKAGHHDLTGDWFITTVKDPKGPATDTMGYNDWGDRAYFAAQHFKSFRSLCEHPTPDLGKSQFPLLSGDIKIGA